MLVATGAAIFVFYCLFNWMKNALNRKNPAGPKRLVNYPYNVIIPEKPKLGVGMGGGVGDWILGIGIGDWD